MKEIKSGKQFKKDLKRYANQPKKLRELYDFIDNYLKTGVEIPPEYHAHMLIGDYAGHMECHIQGDYLLIWFDVASDVVKLIRLGSHSELFG
jgi:mRNA interferase YafQ